MPNLSNRQLIALFLALMLISVYLLYRGYVVVSESHVQAKELIEEQIAKDNYLSIMYASARERSVILLSMMAEEDPFELDELNQNMGENARAFIKARSALTSMPLDQQEMSILTKQNKLTAVNAPIQNQVAELFIEGRSEEARDKLFNTAIPGQNVVLASINQFIELHKTNMAADVADMDDKIAQALNNFQLLAVLIITTSGLFILFTILFSRREQMRLQFMLSEQTKISQELDYLAEKLSYRASHDSLTGLLSRLEFENRIKQILHRAETDATHVVMYLDLDQFKVVNDTCGHQAGDEMLKKVAIFMKDCMRQSDALARLGGDEFGVLLEYCQLDRAKIVAQNIIERLNDFAFTWERKTFRIGISVGMVLVDEHTRSIEDIMRQVDSACYAAKDSGRNRFQIYNHDDKELARRQSELDWVVELERSLERNHFILYAQPIVPTTAGHTNKISYEILIRLKNDNDIVLPDKFLPAAERYNKMVGIDKWVVKNSLDIISENLDIISNIDYFSINLSCQSLTDPGFLDYIIGQFSMHPDIAEHICLEITETAAINSMMQAVKSISVLKGMGVRFALDDFGSGLSSFGYLKTLPINYLKIDGMFVRDMLIDPIDHAMVKAIHDIGTLMDKQTVAEYVESSEAREALTDIGVDYVQGYGVGRPMPLYEVINGLSQPRPSVQKIVAQ